MFKITSLSTDKKSILVLRVWLRKAYTIKNEKELRLKLAKTINNTSQSLVKKSLQDKLVNNEILSIMHYYGIVGKTEIISIKKIND